MDFSNTHKVYFIGIGGIGMSALAHYFIAKGLTVGGYDKTPSDITLKLERLGAKIHFNEAVTHIPDAFKNKLDTLVIYTPAIPKSHVELQYFQDQGFQLVKRSQVLGAITQNTFCLAVAGTHGKTTTTSILGYLLYECKVPVTAFLGGVSENFDSNFICSGTNVSVVEADEFDRSFLTLSPNIACITSMDADHLDIYGDALELHKAFNQFSTKLKPNGKLFVKYGLPIIGITYAINNEAADYSAINIRIKDGVYGFDIKTPKEIIKNVAFSLPGHHNLSNALVAFAMALEYGCTAQHLIKALASYKGVKRRFSYQIKTKELVFIDDYAHHPEEINALHQAVRELYPGKQVVAVFQPHLFSRTRDFADAFAKSLSQFDTVLLLDIYPARELPIPGITSQWLMDKMQLSAKKLISKTNLISEIKNCKAQVVLTIGAGDIGEEVKHIKTELSRA